MILIFGASGTIGSYLVPQLIDRGEEVRVFTRNIERVANYRPEADCVEGDLDQPKTVEKAIKDVDKIFLLTIYSETKQNETVIELAEEEGVNHIVRLSSLWAKEHEIPIGEWHYNKDQILKNSGLSWTILRPNMFMSTALEWADSVKSIRTVFFPGGDGKGAPIHPRDVATAANVALTEPGHRNEIYNLTGPELLTIGEMVQELSNILNKPLRYVNIPIFLAEYFLRWQYGKEQGYIIAGQAKAIKEGKAEIKTDDYFGMTGEAPHSFETWCIENVEEFR